MRIISMRMLVVMFDAIDLWLVGLCQRADIVVMYHESGTEFCAFYHHLIVS